jgi:hypothetical protein
MSADDKASQPPGQGTDGRRRAALAKLGLGAAVAYTTPVILGLESDARAAGNGNSGPPPYGQGGGHGPCSNPSQGAPTGGSSGQGRGCDVASGRP